MSAILGYGFETMKLNRVEALIDPINVASIRLVEGLGFRREGVLRENTHFRGRFIDDAVYALLAREWRAARGGNP
jgi:ribosomal-protein-alanine N-acetyltransferase